MANMFDIASMVCVPFAYKAQLLYSVKPQTLYGFDFTRATTAIRTDADRNLETMAIDVPRVQYPDGPGCPSLLLEPQRTNLFLDSATPATQIITVTDGAVYTISVKGTGSVALSGAGTGTVTDGSPVRITASGTSLTVTVTGSLDYVQVEAGYGATTHVPTTGSTATRLYEWIVADELVTNGFLTDGEGMIYLECGPTWGGLGNPLLIARLGIVSTDCLELVSSLSDNGTPRVRVRTVLANATATSITTTINYANARIIIKYTSTLISLFVNGTKIGEGNRTAFNPNLLQFGLSGHDSIQTYKTIALFDEAQRDSVCIDWTK